MPKKASNIVIRAPIEQVRDRIEEASIAAAAADRLVTAGSPKRRYAF